MAPGILSLPIRRPLPFIVIWFALMAGGALSLASLPGTPVPKAGHTVITVTVSSPGATAAELESQVTGKIEDAVAGVEGVAHFASSVSDGISTTSAVFRPQTDAERALAGIKDAVSRARASLTGGGETLVQVGRAAPPIVTYAIAAPGKTPEQLTAFIEDTVKPRLQGLPGIVHLVRVGGASHEILVSLDPNRLHAAGLTALDVSRSLKAVNVDLAGGSSHIGGSDQPIRALGGKTSLDELAATRIASASGRTVRLDDLGSVTTSIAEPRSFTRFNGEPVTGFAIFREEGASDSAIVKALAERTAQIEADHPDVKLQLINSTANFPRDNAVSAMITMAAGAALALMAVFAFLRSVRRTLIAAITLPFSILPVFLAFLAFGFTLNPVTLLAIASSTGILIAVAFVEIESAARHAQMGMLPSEAAIGALGEMSVAITAICFTIIAVFLPVSFMSGGVGQDLKEFGVTVSLEVFFAWLAALFLTPMLCAYLIPFKPVPVQQEAPNASESLYSRLIALTVRYRYATVAVGLLLAAGSVYSLSLLPVGSLPSEDRSRSMLAIELPPGSKLPDTEAVTEAIVKRLQKRPEVESVFVDGGHTPGAASIAKATLTISYVARPQRGMSQAELEQSISSELSSVPDIRFWFLNDDGERPILLDLNGRDSALVDSVASEIAKQMRNLPPLSNVIASTTAERPELLIHPKLDLCARLGITTEAISEAVRAATAGDLSSGVVKLASHQGSLPVRVVLDDWSRSDLRALEQLGIPSRTGTVPLGSISKLELGPSPASVSRYDGRHQAKVTADIAPNFAFGDALEEINRLPIMKSLPPGVTVSRASAEPLGELRKDLDAKGLLSATVLLILLFGNALRPLTVLFLVPLSIGGAVLGLIWTNQSLTFPVTFGLLLLIGIAAKDAILLMDGAIKEIGQGAELASATITACQKRAALVIMTTSVTMAGIIPIALPLWASVETRAPMAIAVIFGLLISAGLSLLLFPSLFAVMVEIENFLKTRLFGRLKITTGAAKGA